MNYDNPLANRIYNLLEPLMGQVTARGILKNRARKIGISEEDISREHLAEIAKYIEQGLIIFVGSEKAQEVRQCIESLAA